MMICDLNVLFLFTFERGSPERFLRLPHNCRTNFFVDVLSILNAFVERCANQLAEHHVSVEGNE